MDGFAPSVHGRLAINVASHARVSPTPIHCRSWVLAGLLACLGCHTSGSRIVPSPMSLVEQQQKILQITPVGTPLNDALLKLNQAGVQTNQGVSESILYCDLWKRPDGSQWYMNVALLFDESGKLYEARAAQAETKPDTSPKPPAAPATPPDAASQATPPAEPPTGRAGEPREPFLKSPGT